jgi:hypothetical protein
VELNIETLGGACPCQGYGTLDGERFYFRYRHDDAQLEVGPPDEHDDDMPTRPPRLYAEINDVTGDFERGWLDDEDAIKLIHRMIPMLKPPAEWAHGTYQDQLQTAVSAMVDAMRYQELLKADQAAVLDDDLSEDEKVARDHMTAWADGREVHSDEDEDE